MKRIKTVIGKSTIVALATLATVYTADATTVDYSALGAAVVQLDNSLVPAGSLIEIGTFDISDATIAASANDIATLQSHFTVFDTDFVGVGAGGSAGFWSTTSGAVADPTNVYKDKLIYLWVFNATTSGGASQHGIFTSSNAAWKFPDDTAVVDSTSIDLAQVNLIDVGSVGPVLFPGQGDVPSFKLAEVVQVPEPSATLLIGMSFLSFLAIRRRS